MYSLGKTLAELFGLSVHNAYASSQAAHILQDPNRIKKEGEKLVGYLQSVITIVDRDQVSSVGLDKIPNKEVRDAVIDMLNLMTDPDYSKRPSYRQVIDFLGNISNLNYSVLEKLHKVAILDANSFLTLDQEGKRSMIEAMSAADEVWVMDVSGKMTDKQLLDLQLELASFNIHLGSKLFSPTDDDETPDAILRQGLGAIEKQESEYFRGYFYLTNDKSMGPTIDLGRQNAVHVLNPEHPRSGATISATMEESLSKMRLGADLYSKLNLVRDAIYFERIRLITAGDGDPSRRMRMKIMNKYLNILEASKLSPFFTIGFISDTLMKLEAEIAQERKELGLRYSFSKTKTEKAIHDLRKNVGLFQAPPEKPVSREILPERPIVDPGSPKGSPEKK